MGSSDSGFLFLLVILILCVLSSEAQDHSRKIYIVYVNGGSEGKLSTRPSHMDVLQQVLEDGREASESHIYSYRESLTGFAARLTDSEKKTLEDMEDILAVEPSRNLQMQTTRSWDFLGFPTNVHRPGGKAESDLIVGVMDTGIWPDSDSFRDDGLGPPPKGWKGPCEDIKCNNKIIGAKAYYTGDKKLAEKKSVIDVDGHGTHTASTVAGALVPNVSYFGLGKGTARGGAPSARIAVYKICWKTLTKDICPEHDILAAIEDAIRDGVDIISASVGSIGTRPYDQNAISVGAFKAMRKGILTSAAGGNDGPDPFTVANGAPWILTVASSTTDRKFSGTVELGDGIRVTGDTMNTFATQESYYRLDDGPNATKASGKNLIKLYSVQRVEEAKTSAAEGLVAVADICPIINYPLPTVCLTNSAAALVTKYVSGTRNPVGKIYKSIDVLDKNAPQIALSSARGPNMESPDILKPDISAPGVGILAAWSPKAQLGPFPSDKRSSPYNIISGTSMACPHVTGAALYVKSFHPKWSPAAIKSALMTTAKQMRSGESLGEEFAYGSGLINPIKAVNPGLVYDVTESDYVKFLCADGYSDKRIMVITGNKDINCSNAKGFLAKDLNYPSMSVNVSAYKKFTVRFSRTVTNVGVPNAVYKARTRSSGGDKVSVSVFPPTLNFKSAGEKLGFRVEVSGGPLTVGNWASASLIWSDGKHRVRSPIVVHAFRKSS